MTWTGRCTSATHLSRLIVALPCILPQSGRETLENAIRMVNERQEWAAHVVYGDTDSLFVHLPGRFAGFVLFIFQALFVMFVSAVVFTGCSDDWNILHVEFACFTRMQPEWSPYVAASLQLTAGTSMPVRIITVVTKASVESAGAGCRCRCWNYTESAHGMSDCDVPLGAQVPGGGLPHWRRDCRGRDS